MDKPMTNDDATTQIREVVSRGMDTQHALGVSEGRLTLLSEMLTVADAMEAGPAKSHVETFLLSFGKAETWRPKS